MSELRNFPAQVPFVKSDGTLTQPTLQTMLQLLAVVRDLQERVVALEP